MGRTIVTSGHSQRPILLTTMGCICSKSGTHSGAHTVLGSASGGTNPPPPSDVRAAAAEAAERRMKAVSARGADTDVDILKK